MLQTRKSHTLVVALYCLASMMLGYTLYSVFWAYLTPINESNAEIYARLARARTYQFIGGLLWVSSLLVPGIYLAWKDRKFRMMFPALEIFQLAFWRLMVFK
jgi:hypothetical protein